MAEFIDKQLAIKKIKAVPPGNWSAKRYVAELEEMPAADVVPVVHGRFGKHTSPFTAPCSECGTSMNTYWHYCPNCGAKMDGEN